MSEKNVKYLVRLDNEEVEVHTLHDACLYFGGHLSNLYKKCKNEYDRQVMLAAFCGYLLASGKIKRIDYNLS